MKDATKLVLGTVLAHPYLLLLVGMVAGMAYAFSKLGALLETL